MYEIISVSSLSCSSDDDEDENDDSEYEQESISGDDDDDSECIKDNEDESDYDDEDDGKDEFLCKSVISFLKEGKDLEGLSLKDHKAYLRKHGLRIAGSKSVCIQRIKDHWRIKDGNGESLYPRASFVINCRGDVCNGDVVLFTQKVYEKFSKVTRHGSLLGRRTVAGRIVKESYGSAKQQHTFTVEVLWSTGVKKLVPLFPLLVKGRNLYKIKTFRQCWNNEAERVKVLAEKHKRGEAARLVRSMRKTKKKSSANAHSKREVKHQRCSHYQRPSRTRKTAELGKGKHAYGHKKDTSQQHAELNNHHLKPPHPRQVNLKRKIRSDVGSKATRRHLKRGRLNEDMDPAHHAHAYASQSHSTSRAVHDRTVPFHFSGHEMGSSSTMIEPPWRHYAHAVLMPAFQHQWFNHRNDIQEVHTSHSGYNFRRRNVNYFPELIDVNHQSSQGMEMYGQRNRGFQHFHQ